MAAKGTTKKTKTATVEAVVETAEVTVNQEPVETEKVKIVPKEIDSHQTITVHNGFQGKLIYVSKRTGDVYEWPEFGDEQEIELGELRNAKNNNRDFFANNWFLFEEKDAWVIDYLGVQHYYKNAINLEEFDELFTKSAKEIEEIIAGLSDGQKTSVGYRARQLVAEGGIDSLNVISVLENGLGIELVER